MNLYLAPSSPATHQQVCELHQSYELPVPAFPEEALLVTTDGGEVVASTYLYKCGPFLYAEWAIGHPGYSARDLHTAAIIIAREFMTRAFSRGLVPTAAPRIPSVAKILARYGMKDTGCTMFMGGSPVEATRKPPMAPTTTKPRRKVPRRKKK